VHTDEKFSLKLDETTDVLEAQNFRQLEITTITGNDIVACLLKTRIVKAAETAATKKRLRKHVRC
jgi:hypothetical protein